MVSTKDCFCFMYLVECLFDPVTEYTWSRPPEPVHVHVQVQVQVQVHVHVHVHVHVRVRVGAGGAGANAGAGDCRDLCPNPGTPPASPAFSACARSCPCPRHSA